jgi:PLP dependent protein
VTPLSQRYKAIVDQLPRDVELVAISKYAPFAAIAELYELGQRNFGENRVAALKLRSIEAQAQNLNAIEWHFIGQLQTNKVKELFTIPGLAAIHSLDRPKLYETWLKYAALLDSPIDFYIEVKTAKGHAKSGVEGIEALDELLDLVTSSPHPMLRLKGLMTMADHGDTPAEQERLSRASFAQLRSFRDELESRRGLKLKLSMGMSGDWPWALEYSADSLRIGSSIFADS